MANHKKASARYRTITCIATIGLTGMLAFAACVSAPAGQASLVDSAQVNIDDARRLSTAAAANLLTLERQTQIATAEAGRVQRATEAAFRMERERQDSKATQTANDQSAQATHVAIQATSDALSAAATATAQANAMSAQVAIMSFQATATAISIDQDNAHRAAQWEQGVLIPARTIGILVLGCIALFIAFRYGLKAVEALVLHIRIVRDGRGNVMVILPPDAAGRQQFLQPHLAPDPVLSLTPPGVTETAVTSRGGDPDVTRRAQAIDTLNRTSVSKGTMPEIKLDPPRHLAQLTAGAAAAFEPAEIAVIAPAQANQMALADGQALAAIDADWRDAHDKI